MKNKLLLLVLLIAGMAQAQIVNIPDPVFKNFLLPLDNGANGIIDANQDGEIQVSEALIVEHLQIYSLPGVTFTSLQGVEAFTNLTFLTIQTPIASINLSGLSQLDHLMIHNPILTELNLSGLTSLSDLQLQTAQFTSLDISGLTNLTTAFLEVNSLTTLHIGNLNTLYGMWVMSDSLPELDFSGCANLGFVHITLNNEDKDVYINLKNGNPVNTANSSAIYLNSSELSSHKAYVCIDEGEAEHLEYIDEDVVLSTYCSFTPGGNYNTISGTMTFDADGGCDSTTFLPFFKVSINDGSTSGSSFSNSDGIYNFSTEEGTFILTPQFENGWFTVSPASATVTFADSDNNTATQNFCITANGVHNDLEVVLVPVIAAQPGFDAAYQIIYKNKGNQTLSGDVTFTYDDAVLDYVSAIPVETTASAGSLVWAYSNLQPFETRTIDLVLNVNGPMETPSVEIGHELVFDVAVTPLSGDETPQDNNFGYKQTVVGSFDPNDITCLEGDYASPAKIGEYLYYNINFENTGTAPATFIVVKDVIDAAQFDVSSLQLLNASHDVDVRVEGNKVEFFFDDIDLGAQEKGNVVFKIKTLNSLQVNDDVTQQANIYFDYNWPIETNEATTVFQVLGVGEFLMDESVSIYPNPAASFINIKASSAINSVQLYDMQGRLLQASSANDLNAVIDISNRSSGMYVLKVTTDMGVKAEKIFKK